MTALVPDLPKVEQTIIDQTNIIRVQSRLGRVIASPQLTAAARAYATLLATTGQFSHEVGSKPAQRLVQVGYHACGFAENIAMRRNQTGFETQVLAKSVIDGWLKSPVHANNLRRPTMTEIGVGVALSPNSAGEYIAVQLFGRPQSQELVFDVKNASLTPVVLTFERQTRDLVPNKVYTLRACSAGPLSFAPKSSPAPVTHLQAANGKLYTFTAPSKVDVTARKP